MAFPESNKNKIVMTDEIKKRVINSLSDQRFETTIFLFGKPIAGKLVVTDILIPSDNDYSIRSYVRVRVDPEFVAKEFPKFESIGLTLIATVHSHPAGLDVPSLPDIQLTHKNVIRSYPYQLTGVYDHNKINFYTLHNDDLFKVREITVLKKRLERFERQIRFLGFERQLVMSSCTVLLIGLGGGNTVIAEALACMGVKKLILIDQDIWSSSNRNRVFIPEEYIDLGKVDSIKCLISGWFPDVEVEAFPCKAEMLDDEIYKQPDLIVVGPDTRSGRIYGNRKALEFGIPAVFPAAGILADNGKFKSLGGSVQVVVSGETPCYECIAQIDSDELLRESLDEKSKNLLTQKYLLGDFLEIPTEPSIISLNLQISGIALFEIVKLITRISPITPFQVYQDGVLRPVDVYRQSDCPACSEMFKEVIDFATVDYEEETKILDYLKDYLGDESGQKG